MTADEFARNFYIEKEILLQSAFDGERKTFVSDEIEKLNLNKELKEKFKEITSALLTDAFYTILLGLDGSASIGNSNQETFKIYDEEGNLISGCGELEAEAYEYFYENKFQFPGNKIDTD